MARFQLMKEGNSSQMPYLPLPLDSKYQISLAVMNSCIPRNETAKVAKQSIATYAPIARYCKVPHCCFMLVADGVVD